MSENAFLFKNSLSRDFGKERIEAAQLKTVAPQSIGACTKCAIKFLSQCENASCLCRARCAEFCCTCVALDVKHDELPNGDGFNFAYVQFECFFQYNQPLTCRKAISATESFTSQRLNEILSNYPKKQVMIASYAKNDAERCAMDSKRLV